MEPKGGGKEPLTGRGRLRNLEPLFPLGQRHLQFSDTLSPGLSMPFSKSSSHPLRSQHRLLLAQS
jgi:hypothetical protein